MTDQSEANVPHPCSCKPLIQLHSPNALHGLVALHTLPPGPEASSVICLHLKADPSIRALAVGSALIAIAHPEGSETPSN